MASYFPRAPNFILLSITIIFIKSCSYSRLLFIFSFLDNIAINMVFSLCMKVDGSDYFICINMASAVLKSFYISLLHVLQY